MSDQPTTPIMRVKRPRLPAPTPPAAEPEKEPHGGKCLGCEECAPDETFTEELPPAGAPPLPPARQEISREGHAVPLTPGFEARDGDVLVISYGEVSLPLPKQYANCRFGGYIYTRRLAAGDDVQRDADAIATWLARTAELHGQAKYKRISADFKK